VLALIHQLSAQNTLPIFQSKADSLKLLIDTRDKKDVEKVRLLNEFARYSFYIFEIQQGFEAARNARELSHELDFEGGIIMYYVTLSAYFSEGDMFDYYQKQAQWLSKYIGEQFSKYYTNPEIPPAVPPADFDAYLKEHQECIQYFDKLGDKEIMACLLATTAYFNVQSNNPEEAIQIIDKIIVIFSDLDQIYPVFLYKNYKMNLLNVMGRGSEARKIESELVELIAQSENLNENENAIGLITNTMATGFANRGRHAMAIEYYLKSVEAFKRSNDTESLIQTHYNMGVAYENLEMNSRAVESYANCIQEIQKINDTTRLYVAYNYIVSPLIALKRYDEARKYITLSLHDTITDRKTYILARYNDAHGQIIMAQGKYAQAIPYFKKAFEGFIQENESRWSAPFMPLYLSECYMKTGDYKTALKYAVQCLEMENALNSSRTLIKKRISLILSEIYEKEGDLPGAYKYLKMHQKLRSETDKLDEANRIADAEVRAIIEKSQKEIVELEQERALKEQQNKNQRLWILSISGALLSALLLALILYRNNKNKQKANKLLQEQKEEIQSTLEQLEATQSQLIQSEKMASLGELTAGIAHEIQNPLNFVNNFSEISSELIDEIHEELDKGDIVEVKAISTDIKQNLEKINRHGRRAADIVKGMLLHSRTGSGQKEPTDINALADEYLRLAYHGLRAKDKTFNADFKTDFYESLPKINVIPQDIGRVLLNLINNAFYVVNEKSKQNIEGYKPEVTVRTASWNPPSGGRGAFISVSDNGPGIPENIKDKIFQPFFTTKPTGQGTGLGLSLSYDIVKAHGGEIKVESLENEGTEFTIQLPVN
jgi:signal transduction histidine kinase